MRNILLVAAFGILAGCSTPASPSYSPYSSGGYYNSKQSQYNTPATYSQPAYSQAISATTVAEYTPPAYVPSKQGPGSKYQRELEAHNRHKAEAQARERERQREVDERNRAIAAREREKQIGAFLDSDALMGGKVKTLRLKLKSSIAQHDREMERLRETYRKANKSPNTDPRFTRLSQSRKSLKTRLDNLDRRIENAMLERKTGAAAENLIWLDDDLREIDNLYRNAY